METNNTNKAKNNHRIGIYLSRLRFNFLNIWAMAAIVGFGLSFVNDLWARYIYIVAPVAAWCTYGYRYLFWAKGIRYPTKNERKVFGAWNALALLIAVTLGLSITEFSFSKSFCMTVFGLCFATVAAHSYLRLSSLMGSYVAFGTCAILVLVCGDGELHGMTRYILLFPLVNILFDSFPIASKKG